MTDNAIDIDELRYGHAIVSGGWVDVTLAGLRPGA